MVLNAQQSYYNDVDLTASGLSLKSELATKITVTHTNFLDYTPGVWEASKSTDVNPVNAQEVLLIYGYEDGSDADITNDRERGINQNGGNQTDWNREHVFARSLGNPNLGTVGPGADAHHLRPADASRNSSRSNRKFGRGSGNSGFSSVDFHQGNEGPNTAAWYPGDEWKGDVARMMMYMYLRYGDQCIPTAVGVGSTEFTPDNMIDLFLQWNVEDPVSDFERTRNDFHENTANTYAQGNRNPFIDNPYLATRIWGGDSAQDTWGIYTSSDTEAPTVPSNLVVSNIALTSMNVSWDAASDNVAVTGYDVFVDGVLTFQTTATSVAVANLAPNTTYTFTVLAKDAINNKSAQSTPVNGTTLDDNEVPSTPANLTIVNTTDTSVAISWDASTDNVAVTAYDVYLDGAFNDTTTELSYNITGLNPSTTYSVAVLARDASNNASSTASTSVTTTDGSSNTGVTELFFSEYVEPNGGNNKALEIVNLTGSTISLAGYSIRKQSNGAGAWIDDFDLSSGTVQSIVPNDVFVVINEGADDATLVAEADLVRLSNPSTTNGSPINFNGNDPVGLFKNGVLIDVIGTIDGGTANFAKDVTLSRKQTVTGPNTVYDINEWDILPENTFNGIGSYSSTLSTEQNEIIDFKVYPNPSRTGNVTIKSPSSIAIDNIVIYSILGKKVVELKNPNFVNNKHTILNLKSGIYLIKISNSKQTSTKKLVIQ